MHAAGSVRSAAVGLLCALALAGSAQAQTAAAGAGAGAGAGGAAPDMASAWDYASPGGVSIIVGNGFETTPGGSSSSGGNGTPAFRSSAPLTGNRARTAPARLIRTVLLDSVGDNTARAVQQAIAPVLATTMSITGDGLPGLFTPPPAPSVPALPPVPEGAIGSGATPSPAEFARGDAAFFAATVTAVTINASQAARYHEMAQPVIYPVAGIMTPQIAEQMLALADRLPGESPRGMPLAEVLANNIAAVTQQVARGVFVADGTHVIGIPKG
ncbi:hypothetical protein [Novosphingobium huizhouense]|uniref:hypothetical protein n=1 Tax=Novosphingobium huizhouense TaxID=2866625 RepID=UPI001CD85BFB|nr:hypothetical protein [Novosphingobium huizhouense]